MHFSKMYFITQCQSPICFGGTHDHHQGVLGVMVNTLSTACYNTNLVYILIKELKLKKSFKGAQQGVFVLWNSVYMHPVYCI